MGRTVLWDWSDSALRSEIRIGGLDMPETALVVPAVGSYVLGVRSDGNQIAWLGGRDDTSGASVPLNELWTAATDGGRASPLPIGVAIGA